MTTYTQTERNKLLLGWFALQLPITILIDLLDIIWPASFYEPAGSPLHLIYLAREWYIETFNDPSVQWSAETASDHDSWMGYFLYVEMIFILPTTAYGLYRLAVRRTGTSGADELLFLVYFLELAFTTSIYFNDSFYWDSNVYTTQIKNIIRYQFYGPWIVLPTLGAIEMASRILGRIRAADAALEGKKWQ